MANQVPTAQVPLSPPAKPPSRRAQGMPTEAPRLTIHYRCPVCGWDCACDAYDGPPVCYGKNGNGKAHREWMVALNVIKEKGGPLDDIATLTGGWHVNDVHRRG